MPLATAPPKQESRSDEREAAHEAGGPVLIRAEGLGKRFKIYRSPWLRAAEWVTGGRVKRHSDFWALRDVSFELRKGESLGVLGANGAGKSTLLKIVTGALRPTEGACEVTGRVLSMLELGAGLNGELTGRQNIFNMARLLNFPPGYAQQRIDEIEDFADIGPFFDRPVKLYSSGMSVRVTFSMFAAFRPEVLIVDEALSVGDVFFQQRCALRIQELLDGGMTMLLASHDMGAIENLCSTAITLAHGQPIYQGAPKEAISAYYASLQDKRLRPGQKWVPRNDSAEQDSTVMASDDVIRHDVIGQARHTRQGRGGLRILAARVTSADGRDTLEFDCGETMTVHAALEATEQVSHPRSGLRIHDRFGVQIFGAGSAQLDHTLPAMAPGDRTVVRFRVEMNMRPGAYTFGLGASEPPEDGGDINGAIFHDVLPALGPIRIRQRMGEPERFFGVTRLPMTIAHRTERASTDGRGT
ncbi:MAG: ABC transporter ATP-binding protein [Phycisphaerales bacterium JB039]